VSEPVHIEPDDRGRYGTYGGRFVPEVLVPALVSLEEAWREAREDAAFRTEIDSYLRDYAGRPTPLYEAGRFGERIGARVWVKREDLTHTGSHKINNVLGQCLLAKRIGKRRIIAETGAGQHGVATATGAALLGLECVVYMGAEDVRRQELNVFRMQVLGAEVVPVDSGSRTLKDAINETLRDWVTNVETTHYVIGSVVGPHPFPWMVAELQEVIGREAREQMAGRKARRPDLVCACVGVEAGGHGLDTELHGAAISGGSDGVLHGARTRILQDPDGLIRPAHSISAGLDYPGSGPEHAYFQAEGLATYHSVSDEQALDAFHEFSRLEGIVPALEPAHAIAWLIREADAGTLGASEVLLLLSGRGDKDVAQVRERGGR
jgi:tryptophan synthase beta chain